MSGKRKFYIIGHNPNTVDDAIKNLRAGANALEPDIHFDVDYDGSFYVYHNQWPYPDSGVSTLKQYLQGLGQELKKDPSLNLALIAFDIKPPYGFNINDLYTLIRNEFSNEFSGTVILTTSGEWDGRNLLANVQHQHSNEAVGIDQNTTASVSNNFFNPLKINYTYADGISIDVEVGDLYPTADEYFSQIGNAVKLRDAGNSFKMVYAWTVNSIDDMQKYLDNNVDGMIVDLNDIQDLVTLLKSDKYSGVYEIAKNGDNPFA